MRILPQDQAALDLVGRGEADLIGRAVAWSNVNSGSDHAEGLETVLGLLEAEANTLPASVERVPTLGFSSVRDDGALKPQARADALQRCADIVREQIPLSAVVAAVNAREAR